MSPSTDAEPIGPIHPGVILEEQFLEPFGLSGYALAQASSVPRNRITGIVRGERSITADTAPRLARLFDMSPEFWLGLRWATTPRPPAPRSAPGSDRK